MLITVDPAPDLTPYLLLDGSRAMTGNLLLPATTPTVGQLKLGGSLFLHNYAAAGSDGRNTFLGVLAGNLTLGPGGGSSDLGSYNTGIGRGALLNLSTGNFNTALGTSALGAVTTGVRNTAFGESALVGIVTGSHNTAFGHRAGYANTGSDSVFLGYQAGLFETGSNKLFIDNAPRASEADGRLKALVYGVFDVAVANQLVVINGALYSNRAAAVIGSKVALTDGAAASIGTLTNAPAAGNPTKWLGIDDNGTIRYVPSW